MEHDIFTLDGIGTDPRLAEALEHEAELADALSERITTAVYVLAFPSYV